MADYATRRRMMVDTQVRPSDVTKFPIIEAMLSVPREAFVPRAMKEAAYMGENIDLGRGRVMLEPRTLGKMLDILDIQPNDLVLDVGCGFGYSSAVISGMAEAVVAIEDDETMASEAQSILAETGADNVAVIHGNLIDSAAKHGPYDVILLQGGVEQIPGAICDQLKNGGRICAVFVEGSLGICRIGYKIDGQMNWRFVFNAGAPVLKGYEAKPEFAL